jgi:hypothetical protein
MTKPSANRDKSSRGNASQFIVAGELCRRDLVALVTMGNTPNTDILCSNKEGTKFVHIQGKTYVPGNKTVSVGAKAEKSYGKNFIWVLAGIQLPEFPTALHEFYIIPSDELSKNVKAAHRMWMETPGVKGQMRNDSNIRTVHLPPHCSFSGWNIEKFKNRWDIIESLLN